MSMNTTATANENSNPKDMITAVELAAIKRDREELKAVQIQAQRPGSVPPPRPRGRHHRADRG